MLLDGVDRFLRSNDVNIIRTIFSGELWAIEILIGFADHLRFWAIKDRAKVRISENKYPVRILTEDAVRQGLDQRMVNGFRLAQGKFGVTLLREGSDGARFHTVMFTTDQINI